jgi:hypothetical protein
MASTAKKRIDPAMRKKLQRAFALLGEVQAVLTEAFALQGAASPATYKAVDKAWNDVSETRAFVGSISHD